MSLESYTILTYLQWSKKGMYWGRAKEDKLLCEQVLRSNCVLEKGSVLFWYQLLPLSEPQEHSWIVVQEQEECKRKWNPLALASPSLLSFCGWGVFSLRRLKFNPCSCTQNTLQDHKTSLEIGECCFWFVTLEWNWLLSGPLNLLFWVPPLRVSSGRLNCLPIPHTPRRSNHCRLVT